jgi:hypothetical protein
MYLHRPFFIRTKSNYEFLKMLAVSFFCAILKYTTEIECCFAARYYVLHQILFDIDTA